MDKFYSYHLYCLLLALSVALTSSVFPGLGFLMLNFTSFSLIMHHKLFTPIYHSMFLLHFLSLSLFSLSLLFSCWLEVIGTFSQGHPCPSLVFLCLDGWVEWTALSQLGTFRLLVTLTTGLPCGLAWCASFLCYYLLLSTTKSVTCRERHQGEKGWSS